MRRRLERALGGLAVVAATLHFVETSRFHEAFGQFLPVLWMHLWADGCLVVAGVLAWSRRGMAGWLLGAWSFALALTGFVFLDLALQLLENRVSASVGGWATFYAAAFVVSFVGFAASAVVAWPRRFGD